MKPIKLIMINRLIANWSKQTPGSDRNNKTVGFKNFWIVKSQTFYILETQKI